MCAYVCVRVCVIVSYTDINWIRERAIRAPINEVVDKLNHDRLQKFTVTSEMEFSSIRTTVDQDRADQ